ncbi:ribosome-binding factor A [Clostridium aceticum]|uniref:Ribosome-binding factor A n=1 Tax=Clostridium aceticum TaxID=84022 RepID=A0A0D8I7C5_9CLOT|nr:30S ribosome-binding factor RbfA [Clostridium aceticum]AKL95432.1 ribosome-binding factor A [Clostridium aceticum]KJF25922.1 ribosome-binding factor A [Clostridium aceticum]
MAYPRVSRLNEEMKKYISDIIRNELRDPRISSMASIIAVDVTRDLRYGTVYISVLGTEKEKQETIKALQKSAGYVRREVGKKIKTRYTPEILFKLDESIEKGIDMYHKISKVSQEQGIQEEENDGINEE